MSFDDVEDFADGDLVLNDDGVVHVVAFADWNSFDTLCTSGVWNNYQPSYMRLNHPGLVDRHVPTHAKNAGITCFNCIVAQLSLSASTET